MPALFTDRGGAAPPGAPAAPVWRLLWLGSRLWQELGLDTFFAEALQDCRGSVAWSKVLELLAVNRLCDPESELGVHQRWFGGTAMDVILGTDEAVAAKDRLYRALDKALPPRRHWRPTWPNAGRTSSAPPASCCSMT